MEKRTVTIAEMNDDEVQYRQIDDCYVCSYDTGDKFTEHTCGLTSELLSYSGKHDIDVPESCPFPAKGVPGSAIRDGLIDRYPRINERVLSEIEAYIIKSKRARAIPIQARSIGAECDTR